MQDIDKRDMKVIQVFICHVSFVPSKFVFACLTQFDGCEQCGSEPEDFFLDALASLETTQSVSQSVSH